MYFIIFHYIKFVQKVLSEKLEITVRKMFTEKLRENMAEKYWAAGWGRKNTVEIYLGSREFKPGQINPPITIWIRARCHMKSDTFRGPPKISAGRIFQKIRRENPANEERPNILQPRRTRTGGYIRRPYSEEPQSSSNQQISVTNIFCRFCYKLFLSFDLQIISVGKFT